MSSEQRRDLVRRHLQTVLNRYEDTGRRAASCIVAMTELAGGALLTLFWSFLAALICGAIFGGAGYAVGFLAVWIGVWAPGLGSFLLMLATSAVPGAVVGGVLCLLFGTSFFAWWFLGTVGVIVFAWAKTVTVPPPCPPAPLPQIHGHAQPADADELNNLEYLE